MELFICSVVGPGRGAGRGEGGGGGNLSKSVGRAGIISGSFFFHRGTAVFGFSGLHFTVPSTLWVGWVFTVPPVATIPSSPRLRKRAKAMQGGKDAGEEVELTERVNAADEVATDSTSGREAPMAYGRRTINFYQRGAVGGDSLPLSSYRNKVLVFLAATAVYTAFLWKSGVLQLFAFTGYRAWAGCGK